MVMQNINGLASFQHHFVLFGMVMQIVTSSCKTNFQAASKTISLVYFTQSCETYTPLILLYAVLFNNPYLPHFSFDLHTL